MEKKKIIPLFLIFLIVFLLYHPLFGVFFSGDDFFHFQVSMTDGSLKQFLNFFWFHPFAERGIAFYRPLFREVLYNTFYSLFGLNHLPFRILQFGLHLLNIFLVFLLSERLFGKRKLSLFAAFFFGIGAANVGVLYYLAGGIQGQGTTLFLLLSLLLFNEYLEKKEIKFKLLTFLCFVLGLMSHEQVIATVPLLAGLILLKEKKVKLDKSFLNLMVRIIQKLWLPTLICITYLALNYLVIGFSQSEVQYQPVFNIKKTLNTFFWYGIWSLGMPEMLVDYLGPGLQINANLIKFWGNYFLFIFPAFAVSFGLIVYLWRKANQILKDKYFWFLASWFILALLPVLFLPLHKKTYYLAPALPAFWILLSYLIQKFNPKIFILYLIPFLILNISSILLADKTYWAIQRGRLAEKMINQMKQEYPELPQGAKVYIKNDPDYPTLSGDWQSSSKQAFYILNGSDALQLLYHDPSLKVYYEDISKPEEKSFLPIVLKLN